MGYTPIYGLLNYKQVTIHHHLPSITNGFSNQKKHKKAPSFTRICWSCYPSKPSPDCLSFIGFILGHSRQAALCRLEEISVAGEMFIISLSYDCCCICIYTIKLYCIIDNVGNVGNVGNDGNVGNVTTVGNVGVCVCVSIV